MDKSDKTKPRKTPVVSSQLSGGPVSIFSGAGILQRVELLKAWIQRHPIATILLAILPFLIGVLPEVVTNLWGLWSEEALLRVIGRHLPGIRLPTFSLL